LSDAGAESHHLFALYVNSYLNLLTCGTAGVNIFSSF